MSEHLHQQLDIVEPLRLVSQTGMAALMGVSKQRVSQLKGEGVLPQPFAVIDGRVPVWTEDQALEFALGRLVVGQIEQEDQIGKVL